MPFLCAVHCGGSENLKCLGKFQALERTSADPEQKKKKLAAELANGRLAMPLGCNKQVEVMLEDASAHRAVLSSGWPSLACFIRTA